MVMPQDTGLLSTSLLSYTILFYIYVLPPAAALAREQDRELDPQGRSASSMGPGTDWYMVGTY